MAERGCSGLARLACPADHIFVGSFYYRGAIDRYALEVWNGRATIGAQFAAAVSATIDRAQVGATAMVLPRVASVTFAH